MDHKNIISDDDFFEDLCNTYFQKVYNYCRKVLMSKESDLAEDCTQITFLEAWAQISKLKEHPNIEGWLYTTTKHKINTLFRKQHIQQKYEVLIDENLIESLSYLDSNIEQLFSQNIDIDVAASMILEELNSNDYSLYKDYFKEHLAISELKDKYNVSTTAITTRIYRLKKKIKCIINKYLENI